MRQARLVEAAPQAAADPEPRIRRLGPVIGPVRAARLRHPWVPYLRMGHLQRPRSPLPPWIDMSRPRPLPPSHRHHRRRRRESVRGGCRCSMCGGYPHRHHHRPPHHRHLRHHRPPHYRHLPNSFYFLYFFFLLRPYFLVGARFLKEFIFLSAFELVLGLTLWDS